jgi:hypothetical protein
VPSGRLGAGSRRSASAIIEPPPRVQLRGVRRPRLSPNRMVVPRDAYDAWLSEKSREALEKVKV